MALSKVSKAVKVSVYIASYNYGRFLEQAIESVLRQHFSDWELLIIDDGSTDETSKIMQLYANHPKVKLFKLENIGLPAVANFALNKARGEYLIRLDGDDIFDENGRTGKGHFSIPYLLSNGWKKIHYMDTQVLFERE